MSQTIIIIGAGAAGLVAAKDLSSKGYAVTIVEAAERVGGRMHTLLNEGFTKPVEAAAEFLHGNLPITLELLKQAGISYHKLSGKTYRIEDGKLKAQKDSTIDWDELIEKMLTVKTDQTVGEFLEQHFNGDQHEELRKSVIRFAEGFDLADINKASVFSLRDEWMNEEEDQYRIEGGYIKLVDYLVKQCELNGCHIHTSTKVTDVNYGDNKVNVVTANGETFTADKIIITVSLGILQLTEEHPSYIRFDPAIPDYINAAKQIGFGSVIKVLIEFKKVFWKNLAKDIGFAFAEEKIPTWWTQAPNDYPLLTGWVGGGEENRFKDLSEEEILQNAFIALSKIFNKSEDELKKLTVAIYVTNWKNEPNTLGAYSYDMLESKKARQLLIKPINNTVFFAGEGLYEGHAPGTVEAAFSTGKDVVKLIEGA